jgi:protein regulator of cytokinesis 1
LLIFRGGYAIALMLLYLLFQTEVEVERLNALKARKMKELVFKRQNELEEIYRGVHMDVDSDAAREILGSLVDSGSLNSSCFKFS